MLQRGRVFLCMFDVRECLADALAAIEIATRSQIFKTPNVAFSVYKNLARVFSRSRYSIFELDFVQKEFVTPFEGKLNADAWLLKAAALECDKMYDQASNAFQTALKIQATSEEGRRLFLFM